MKFLQRSTLFITLVTLVILLLYRNV